MRLTALSIKNYRSVRQCGPIRIEPLQSLVGENNSGKSNILRALQCFLSAGAGGMEASDFNDHTRPAIIECEFGGLTDDERKRLRPYLIGDRVVLRKELTIARDETRNRTAVKADYHGYQAEPVHVHLSISKLEKAAGGSRVKWKEVAEAAGITAYVTDTDGRINKASYISGVARYLAEHDVEYDAPTLGETQALGIPQNLLSALPNYFLLPAITDYSDEVDRRSTSTVFRRLMSNLADRIMSSDPRYTELENALSQVRALLNSMSVEGLPSRLATLNGIEDSLRDLVRKLMPGVQSVSLGVDVDTSRDIFSRGMSMKIDDGVLTDVLDKGHGMQRSFVFSLLQMLMKVPNDGAVSRSIILAIEEPELYIHPHCQRLIFHVLREFVGIQDDDSSSGGKDQVIYTTHSPAFVEVWNYDRIGVVRKPDSSIGTIVRQAEKGILGSAEERKSFKVLTSFGLKHNEVFFARDAILVEGPEDEVGIIATARKLGRIADLTEEIGVSVVVTNGKGDIPKFRKVLSAFGLGYGVLVELDGNDELHKQTAPILSELNGNRIAKVPKRIEDLLKVGRHFDDQRHAKEFFSDPRNINADMERVVTSLLP